MTQGTIGIILLLVIATGSGLIFHIKVKDYWQANIMSGLTASICLHILNYFWIGYLDPFFLISLVTAVVVSIFIAAFIGKFVRRKKE